MVFRTISTILIIFFFSVDVTAQNQEYRTNQFEIIATSVIRKTDEGEKQIIRINNYTDLDNYSLDIRFPNGISVVLEIGDKPLVYREVPVLLSETKVIASFSTEEQLVFQKEFTLKPPKEWTIYDIQVSHHDLGYADYYHMMRRDVREMGIEMALDFCSQTDNNPPESQFRWTVETSEPLLPFLQNQSDSVIQELKRRIEEGRISLGAIHNSASTEHLSYETYARLFYTPNRYVVDWLGIPPARTALNTDVVGFTWSLSQYCREADLQYFFIGRNSTVNEFENLQEEPAFFWNPRDGENKETLFKVFEYYSPDRLIQYNLEEVEGLLAKNESKDNWPYDCLMAEDSYDFSLPSLSNIEGIVKWNAQFSNPVIISGTFDQFFDHLSSQEQLRPFVEFSKDVPNSWSDQDYGDAKYAAKAHRLSYHLPEIEKFAAISQSIDKGRYPWEELYQAYNRLLMYSEHTNGSYAEGPIYVPESLKDESAANACYYEVEQAMHRALVDEASRYTDQAAEAAFGSLEKAISNSSDFSLIVFNSLNFNRSDIVTFIPPKAISNLRITDNSTKKLVPYQFSGDTVVFIAKEIPPTGYKTYMLSNKNKNGKNTEYEESDKYLENEYYLIEFDEKTGAISSIFDKELQKELVDRDAPYDFNGYIYQQYKTKDYEPGTEEYRTDSAMIKCTKGDLMSKMESYVFAYGCDSIRQSVTIYKGIKRIDFDLELVKSHSGRSLQLYREGKAQNKEALFYSFPFNIEDFTIRHELAGGSVEPITDQSAGSSTDYYAIQHYSDISNSEYGISLILTDPNLIEYGQPRPAPWHKGDGFESILKKPDNPYTFLYLANNMFFTNMRQSQHGKINMKWSITSHKGDWREGKVYKKGWLYSHPLMAIVSEGKHKGILPEQGYSFLKTDSDNVICSTIKPAEANGEGYIVRFFEIAGLPTEVKAEISLGINIHSANETNLIEDDREKKIELLSGNTLNFSIEPFGIKTIRLIPARPQLSKPLITTARAISDREILLEWNLDGQEDDDIAYYKIHRSEEKGFSPDQINYIGSTGNQVYYDKPVVHTGGWISQSPKPETLYHYKIIPVGTNNVLGEPSDIVNIKTQKTIDKNQAPAKVQGIEAVHLSDIAAVNFNAIFFYTNLEDDVIKYRIHRSWDKGFTPSESDFLAEIDARKSFEHITPHGFASARRELREYNRQLFVDEDVDDQETYFYRICAEDEHGKMGEFSEEVSITPKVMIIDIQGNRSFSDHTTIEIKPSINENREIRYTLNGTDPTNESSIYENPIRVNNTTTVKASIFENGQKLSLPVVDQTFYKANDYELNYTTPYNERWSSTGALALVDNAKGEYYTDGSWQGFEYNDMELVIDLKESVYVNQVKSTFLGSIAPWIFLPQFVEYSVSEDGKTFTSLGQIITRDELVRKEHHIEEYQIDIGKEIRYIRVYARNQGVCPPWHLSAGGKAWIFIDEIEIN